MRVAPTALLFLPSLLGTTTEAASCLNDINECEAPVTDHPSEYLINADGSIGGAEPTDICQDQHENCNFWAHRGECESNPQYMLQVCPKTCRSCSLTMPEELEEEEEETFEEEEEEYLALGVPQTIEGDSAEIVRQTIEDAFDYMENVVLANPDKYPQVLVDGCKNREPLCAYWAAIGECEKNPSYMKLNCAPVCQSCDQLDHHIRCPLDPDAKNALEPGDLHRMFERIIVDEFCLQFQPTVHSRPVLEGHEGIYGRKLEEGQIEGPWVVTFDSFFTDEEADRLIELGYQQGYQRSTDVGGTNFDGTYTAVVSSGRTSHNAWCADECNDDTITRRLWQRIERVTGIPETNMEYFQILRYEEGQQYNFHHDYIEHDIDRPTGPRILTFFLYLSDVEEGGGTQFPYLGNGLTVLPKKGKALLWPSVLNDDPSNIERLTHHAALPVVNGTKFAANAWIHLRDFKTPHAIGC